MWSRLYDLLEEMLSPTWVYLHPPKKKWKILFPLLLIALVSQGNVSRILRYSLQPFDSTEKLVRFLLCVIGFDFLLTCGTLSLPSIKSITYAVLIRLCKSNIKIVPWGNPMAQLCHFISPFATLTRQGRRKCWAWNDLFKATIQHTLSLG